MVMNTFKESKESYFAQFFTKFGWIDFVLGNLIWGYLVLRYIHVVNLYLLDLLSNLPQFLIEPFSWMLIGILSSVLGLAILFFNEGVVKFLGIKNKRIFR